MTIHERPPCTPVEGILMRIFMDDSQPASSPAHRWTETTWEGKGKLFKVPLHWHQYHDEFITVLEGEMDVYHDDEWKRVTPKDGTLFVKRTTVHGFTGVPGVKVVFKEAINPDGDYKEAFFRDMGQQNPPGFWLVMRAFYDWDVAISLGRWSPKWLDSLFITVLGGIAKMFAPPKLVEAELPKP